LPIAVHRDNRDVLREVFTCDPDDVIGAGPIQITVQNGNHCARATSTLTVRGVGMRIRPSVQGTGNASV
jgi:hypothetical protein